MHNNQARVPVSTFGLQGIKRVPQSLLDSIAAFGGPSLVQKYLDLWAAAEEPNYPEGFILPQESVQNDAETRLLFSLNLLDRPNHTRDHWVIYRHPGYAGPVRIARNWLTEVKNLED